MPAGAAVCYAHHTPQLPRPFSTAYARTTTAPSLAACPTTHAVCRIGPLLAAFPHTIGLASALAHPCTRQLPPVQVAVQRMLLPTFDSERSCDAYQRAAQWQLLYRSPSSRLRRGSWPCCVGPSACLQSGGYACNLLVQLVQRCVAALTALQECLWLAFVCCQMVIVTVQSHDVKGCCPGPGYLAGSHLHYTPRSRRVQLYTVPCINQQQEATVSCTIPT